jgi:hypothetical protein
MAAALAGSTVLMASGLSLFAEEQANPLKSLWRLNPAFRIRLLSSAEIELYTHLKTGEVLAHRFSGLEADILLSISEGKTLESLIQELAGGRNMSESDCRRATAGSLKDFVDAQLIYTGDRMIVKKVEVIYE